MDPKRTKRLFIGAMLAMLVIAQVGLRFAKQVLVHQRGSWLIVLMALPVLPLGFVYGRNSARKDGLGKLARAFAAGAAGCLLVGGFLGAGWRVLDGLGAGFLVGYALGWMVQRKAHDKYGDTLEADRYLNIARSEREPTPERPSFAYLHSQDKPTQRLLKTLYTSQVLALLVSLALVFWLVFADALDAIIRAIHARPGDGTRYFVTLDSIYAVIPLMLLAITGCAVVCERVMPILAGSKRAIWLEYYRLTQRRRRYSPVASKIGAGILCAVVVASLAAVILCADTYTKITDAGIAINRFWGLGARFYHWNEVKGVEIRREPYTCNKGHRHTRLVVKIAFTDGSDWVPDTASRRTAQIEAAARYAAARTQP